MSFSPEYQILESSVAVIRAMVVDGSFTASQGERVMPLTDPAAVRQFTIPAGASPNQGLTGIAIPAILVSVLDVRDAGRTVNSAEDVLIPMLVQVVAPSTASDSSSVPLRSYLEWINAIRLRFLSDPLVFRSRFTAGVADPYWMGVMRKTPADASRLIQLARSVSSILFGIKVRHYRS